MSAELASLVTSLAQRARAASLVLATAPTTKKNAALAKLADLIDASHAALLDANRRDLASPEATALTAAARDRLTLNEKRLEHLATSVREVIALPDPVGDVLEEITRPNGLRIRKLRVPIGVIGIIYESRPNLTADAASLCFKSGNATILRGGKEALNSNQIIAKTMIDAGRQAFAHFLESRRLRLLRTVAATDARSRYGPLPDAEALLEPLHRSRQDDAHRRQRRRRCHRSQPPARHDPPQLLRERARARAARRLARIKLL